MFLELKHAEDNVIRGNVYASKAYSSRNSSGNSASIPESTQIGSILHGYCLQMNGKPEGSFIAESMEVRQNCEITELAFW